MLICQQVLTSCETEIHMAESELLCVRVTILLRNKYICKHSNSDVRIVKIFYFIVLDICLSLTTAQEKNIDIPLVIYLARIY